MLRLLKVRGNSLWPEFREGDYVLAAGVPFPACKIQAGDVIVFRQHGFGTLIKRVCQVLADSQAYDVRGTQIDSTDSRDFGPVRRSDVAGKVIWHIKGHSHPQETEPDLKADLLLLLTAVIWGFAFVAQRVGMDHMGPFTFNGIRFSLGALALLPFMIWRRKKTGGKIRINLKHHLVPLLLTGLVLFIAASLQQVGLVGTTAGKAGFITGLYVILVPLLALLWGARTHPAHWAGAFLAVVGLYLLSVRGGWGVSPYDLIVLAGAFMWAVHVHLIARYAVRIGAVRLAMFQFAICGVLSTAIALLFEPISLNGIGDGLWAILYGSFLSVGLAYTLQVVAQRTANPTHAVIIMSLEGAFAALGGWLVLGEVLTPRDLIGAGFMLAGMFISQFLGKPQVKAIQMDATGKGL